MVTRVATADAGTGIDGAGAPDVGAVSMPITETIDTMHEDIMQCAFMLAHAHAFRDRSASATSNTSFEWRRHHRREP